MTTAQRLRLARVLTAAALLATFWIARGLWLDHPYFGTIPVFEGLPRLASPVDAVVLGVLAALLLPALLLERPGKWVLVWCGLFAARCAWDRITWQPYLYQYFFMLLVLGLAEGRRERDGLNALRLVLVSVYFWSGVAKFNHQFLEDGVVRILTGVVSEPWIERLQSVALAIPILETAMALGLLTSRFRVPAVVLALGMHASILAMIGPLGLDYNHVVWPWNLVMMGLLPLLFLGGEPSVAKEVLGLREGTPPFHWAVLVFFGVCPALAKRGLWDEYLSFELYAASEPRGTLFVTEAVAERMPASAREQLVPARAGGFALYLRLVYWSETELGAFAPPNAAVYRHVARRFCALAGGGPRPSPEVGLVLESAPDWITGETEQNQLLCGQF